MTTITNSRGSALVIVLVITSVLFLGCMYLVKVAKESISTAGSLLNKLNAEIIADSMVEEFKFLGATGEFSPNELICSFGDDIGMKREIPLDGTIVRLGKKTRFQAWDAGARLNVWGSNPAALARMYEILSGDDSKVYEIQDCLLDWFDRGDLKRLNGAKSYYYKTELEAMYGPRDYNAPQCVDELSLVKGLDDPSTWEMLKKELLLAPDVAPNLNTMDKTMLRAVLGINEDTADYLLAIRKEKGCLSYFDVSSATGIDAANLVEYCSTRASGVIDLRVEAVSGDARESERLLMDFRPSINGPFEILEADY